MAPAEVRPWGAAAGAVEGALAVAGVDAVVFEGRPVLMSIEPLLAGTLAFRRHPWNDDDKCEFYGQMRVS